MAIGLRYTLETDSTEGLLKKDIFVATACYGKKGVELREAMRAYKKLLLGCSKFGHKLNAKLLKLQATEPEDENFLVLAELTEDMIGEAEGREGEVAEAALKIVGLSLSRNYSADEIEAILEMCNDKEIQQLVTMISTGEKPADFTRSDEAPPSPTTTEPSAALPDTSSCETDSQELSSNGEK